MVRGRSVIPAQRTHSKEMSDERCAEKLIAMAKEIPATLAPSVCTAGASASRGKTIHDRLVELYVELCREQPPSKMCRSASNLLAKLVKRDGLSCLVVNLLPQSEGYTLAFKGKSGIEGETIKLPYEESEFLEYLDNEELPPAIADLLEKSPSNLFYSGCVICEVRDYRRNVDANYQSRYVLLQPSNQSLLADINSLTSDGRRWPVEDRLLLEGQLLLATAPQPLCLDPSPVVCLVHNRLQYERRALHSVAVKRATKKYTQIARNRQRLLAAARSPPELRMFDAILQRRRADQSRSSTGSCASSTGAASAVAAMGVRLVKPVLDAWKLPLVDLAVPKTIDVDKYAKVLERGRRLSGTGSSPEDDNTPTVVEEFTLETERTPGKIHYTRLVLLQQPVDEMFFGQQHVERDYAEGDQPASTRVYSLGNKDAVSKYLKQFFEIFTEEGRRQVKITRSRPGQASRVTYTQAQQQSQVAGPPWPTPPTEDGSGDSSSNAGQAHGHVVPGLQAQQQQQQQQQLQIPVNAGTFHQLHPSLVGAGDGPTLQLPTSAAASAAPPLRLSIGSAAGLSIGNNVSPNVLLSGRQLPQQQQQQLLLQQSTQRVRQQMAMLGSSSGSQQALSVAASTTAGTVPSGLALIVASAQQTNQTSSAGNAAQQLTIQPSIVGAFVSAGQTGGSAVGGPGGSLLLTPSPTGGSTTTQSLSMMVATSSGSSGHQPQQHIHLQSVQQVPPTVVAAVQQSGTGQQQQHQLLQQGQQPIYMTSAAAGGSLASLLPLAATAASGGTPAVQSTVLSQSGSQNFMSHVIGTVRGTLPLQLRQPSISAGSQPLLQQISGSGTVRAQVAAAAAGSGGLMTLSGSTRHQLQQQQLPPPSPQLLEALQSSRPLVAAVTAAAAAAAAGAQQQQPSTTGSSSGQQQLLLQQQQQHALIVTVAATVASQSPVLSSLSGLSANRVSITSSGGPSQGQQLQLGGLPSSTRLSAASATLVQPRTPEDVNTYQRPPHQGLTLQQQQQRLQSQQQALLVPHAQIRLSQQHRFSGTSLVANNASLVSLQQPVQQKQQPPGQAALLPGGAQSKSP